MADQNVNFTITAKGQQAKNELKDLNKGVGSLTSSFKNLAGIFGVGLGIAGLMRFVKSSIDGFNEEARAVKLLETTLGKTTESLTRFAAEMQRVTVYGDEQIIMAQKMIADFTKDELVIKRVTQATLDFAAAKQIDLVSASEIVSKSLFGQTNMLGRYGVKLDETKKGADKVTEGIKKIGEMFGGQALAAADTFEGKMIALKNVFGDMQESIGKLLASPAMISFFEKMTKAVQGWTIILGGESPDKGAGKELRQEEYFKTIKNFTKEQLSLEWESLDVLAQKSASLIKSRNLSSEEHKIEIAKARAYYEQLSVIQNIEEWKKKAVIVGDKTGVGIVERLKLEIKSLGEEFEKTGSLARVAQINVRLAEIAKEVEVLSKLGTWGETSKGVGKKFKLGFDPKMFGTMTAMDKAKMVRELGLVLEVPIKPVAPAPEVSQFAFDSLKIVADSAAQTIESGFMQMWQNVFGEANSLLGQFFQNIAAGIARLASEKLAADIFSFVLGLATSGGSSAIFTAADFASGKPYNGSKQASNTGTIVIPVYVGTQKVDTVIVDSVNRSQRLRKL